MTSANRHPPPTLGRDLTSHCHLASSHHRTSGRPCRLLGVGYIIHLAESKMTLPSCSGLGTRRSFFTGKVPLQNTALEPRLLAPSEDAVYQITPPLVTTSPGQALEMTGLGGWEREFNRMSEPSLPCSPRPTLMQANTSTCQPGGFLSLLTEGLGL